MVYEVPKLSLKLSKQARLMSWNIYWCAYVIP